MSAVHLARSDLTYQDERARESVWIHDAPRQVTDSESAIVGSGFTPAFRTMMLGRQDQFIYLCILVNVYYVGLLAFEHGLSTKYLRRIQ